MSGTSIARLLVRRGFTLLRKEGPVYFAKRMFSFSGYLVRRHFINQTVYLYEHSLESRDRQDYLPHLDSWELRVIHSNEDADAVAADGFEDYRDTFVFARRSLDKGAVAFCVYTNKELAHVGWLAVDAEGKGAVYRFPFEVAFENGQACTGGTYTIPKFRGRGLMPYGYFERFEYLRARGFTSSRNSVTVDNVASHKAHSRFSPHHLWHWPVPEIPLVDQLAHVGTPRRSESRDASLPARKTAMTHSGAQSQRIAAAVARTDLPS